MKRELRRQVTYPHPIDKVWLAITDPALLGAWLMPNDFKPEVGHRFTFTTEPAPGFDGVVHCEVLEVEPPTASPEGRHARVRYTWRGGPIDTVLTLQLEAVEAGTQLTVEQAGFEGLRALAVSLILGHGMKVMFDKLLPEVLDQMPAETTPPAR